MKENKLLRRLMPYMVAVAAFVAVPSIYFAPQFSGKTLVQSDMTQWKGMAQSIEEHREAYGDEPQWSGSLFSGMPANQISMEHNSMLLHRLKGVTDLKPIGEPASMIVVAMLAFFVMLLMCGVNPWAAIAPSIAYGLSTYFFIIIGVGHVTKMWALAYAPLMLGAVFYTFRRNMWTGAAMTALFMSMELAAWHVQVTYYFLMVLAAFWINELVVAIKDKTLPHFAKATGLVVIAGMLALGSNAAGLYDTLQYTKYSMRGKSELSTAKQGSDRGLELEYATAWSYGKVESFNMLIPGLVGNSSSSHFPEDGKLAQTLTQYGARGFLPAIGTYWGPQDMGTAGPTYIGAAIIFLCVLGAFLLRGRCKWWVVAITLLALMLAWGRNFMWLTELFFNVVPGYSKFRTVAMILVIAQWSVPFLGALILGKLWKAEITKAELLRGLRHTLYLVGGATLLFLVFGGAMLDFTGSGDRGNLAYIFMQYGGLAQQDALGLADRLLPAMIQDRAAIMRADALRSLIFVLLTFGVVWLFAVQKLKKVWMAVLLGALVVADLVPVNLRFLKQSDFHDKTVVDIKPTRANEDILRDKTLGFRVANRAVSTFNDATTSYFHRSIGGYHGAKMQRYQDVIDRYLSKMDMNVYNMLNTRYFIIRSEGGAPIAQLNYDANGPAWFVQSVKVVGGADAELAALGQIDTKTEAVVDREFAPLLTISGSAVDSTARIELTDYRENRLIYDYYAPQEAVAIFSEIYYDRGWKAFVDGVETPHFRADYILRGMVLPAGGHTVEFRYRAAGYDLTEPLSYICSLLIIAAAIAALVAYILCLRKKRSQNA